MLLSELITPSLISCELSGRTKDDVIGELVNLFASENIIENKDEFIEKIKVREQIESTAIGNGIAIPHARSSSVKKLAVAFGKSKDGVDFDSADEKPVYLFFMIAAPENAHKEYLQAVAKVARFLKCNGIKEKLLTANSKEDVIKIISEFDNIYKNGISVKTKEGRVIYTQK